MLWKLLVHVVRGLTLFTFLALLTIHGGNSQDKTSQLRGLIQGHVLDGETHESLPLVNIILEGTQVGATSSLEGTFEVAAVPPGTYTLLARLVGYSEERRENVKVLPGRTIIVTIEMFQTIISLEEVRVTAERARKQEDTRTSVLEVEPSRAKTLAGVGEDVFRTLQTLPGVIAPNDFSSQLAIRGSGPDQNLIIMDDIEVFNPYRLYGTVSMFNPETVTEIQLMTGGFGAKYGDRLSAVLDVSNKEGRRETGLHGSVNASITNANVVIDGSYPFDVKGSYVLSARRTYYDLILGPIARSAKLVSGDVAFPNFADFQGKFTIEPEDGHKVILNGIASKDAVDVVSSAERETPDSVNVRDNTRNDVLGVSWQWIPNPQLFSNLGVSWYRNSGDAEFGGEFVDPSLNRELYENRIDTLGIRFINLEFDSRYLFDKFSIKEELTMASGAHSFNGGLGLDLLSTTLQWNFRPDPALLAILRARNLPLLLDFEESKHYSRAHLFIQDKLKLNESITFQAGVRFDYYDIIRSAYVQPRLSTSYAVDAVTTLRGAFGLYRQSPGYEKLLDQSSFLDLTNAAVGNLSAEKATHYVLGIERWIDNQWRVQLETYFKDFDDVIVQDIRVGTFYRSSPIQGQDIHKVTGWTTPALVVEDSTTTDPINGATGSSYGVEFILEKKNLFQQDKLSGWVSYSFARAKRVRGNTITPFRFDQRHTINVVLDYQALDWLNLGLRWKYGSGLPLSEPVGIRPRIIAVDDNGQTRYEIQTDANDNVVFDIDRGGEEDRFNRSLPPYHRLDIRLTADADYWGLDWDFYIDVINVYNRSNVISYNFFIKDDLTIGNNPIHMLPLLPTLGFSVRF